MLILTSAVYPEQHSLGLLSSLRLSPDVQGEAILIESVADLSELVQQSDGAWSSEERIIASDDRQISGTIPW